MESWSLVPGIGLIVASYVIQFGSYLRRPIPASWVLTATRMRFTGFGVLILGVSVGLLISAFRNGLLIGSLLVGLFLMAMAGTWFYAASDNIFRGPPPEPPEHGASRR